MRTADVDDAGVMITRHDAILDALLNNFFKDRLTQLEISREKADIFSLIIMNDDSEVVFEKQDRSTARKIIRNMQSLSRYRPRSHGNYLPAMEQLGTLIQNESRRKSVINVFFLSDGKPSDAAPKGPGTIQEKVTQKIVHWTGVALFPVWKNIFFSCSWLWRRRFSCIGANGSQCS